MAENKTVPTGSSVEDFIASVEPASKREDAKVLDALFRKVTGEEPQMWGPSIIGLGHYHYKYASGRENDWFLTGLSPRKQSLTLYIMNGFSRYNELLSKLGKYKTGKSCLYIKDIEDVDLRVLEELISTSVEFLKSRN